MILRQIKLENFRNVGCAQLDFSDGVNLLYGKNAEGKTNILEAIYFFTRGKSFRGGKESELIRFGQRGCKIEITCENANGTDVLEYAFYDGQRQRKKNGVKVTAREMIGYFPAVLFCPDHLSIIKSAPALRREFLNVALSSLYPEYLFHIGEHKKVSEQKNALLKSEEEIDRSLLAAYNDKLAEVSAQVYCFRRDYIGKLNGSVKKTMDEISGGREDAQIFYQSDIPAEISRLSEITSYYKNLFIEYERREIAAKMCLCGVSRDDMHFCIGGRDARVFASQGQQRSLALALKIGEGELVASIRGEAPVYLFDDVLGELDEERKKYVLTRTADKQRIVTACEKDDYSELSGVRLYRVEGGEYKLV
ncbi:MAG: DNA replication and repair protein RecF [Clostridia bacterium]|nr:DNA replication and repair protein RecF [Clostridia bacterium]